MKTTSPAVALCLGFIVLKSAAGPTLSTSAGTSLALEGHRAGRWRGRAGSDPALSKCSEASAIRPVWVLILDPPCTRLGGYFPSLSLSFLSGKMGIKTRLTLEGHRFNTVMCEVLRAEPDV